MSRSRLGPEGLVYNPGERHRVVYLFRASDRLSRMIRIHTVYKLYTVAIRYSLLYL